MDINHIIIRGELKVTKKQFIIILIILLCLSVIFSGCDSDSGNGYEKYSISGVIEEDDDGVEGIK